jgi:hypothetical protein
MSSVLLGRKTTGSLNALHRDRIRREERRALAPSQSVVSLIDAVLLQIDQTKTQVQEWLTTHPQP